MSTKPRRTSTPAPDAQADRFRRRRTRLLVVAGAVVVLAGGAAAISLVAGHGQHAGAATTGCADSPSSCGYPDASNSGVPAGTTLKSVPSQVSSGTGWHYDSRGYIQVDGNGANLTGLSIVGSINIVANNVTLTNDKIVGDGANTIGVSLRHTSGVTITHCTIMGTNTGSGRILAGVKDVFGDSTGMQITANNISMFETGVQLESGLVKDNYIHDPGFIALDHTNGIMSNGGQVQLTITHNTVFNQHGQADAIALFEDFSPQANRTITNNLVAGGAYSIYGGATKTSEPTSNIVITGNRFATQFFAKGGAYGPIAYFAPSGKGNTWSNNTWDTSRLSIPSP
jgi:hypothetical protein